MKRLGMILTCCAAMGLAATALFAPGYGPDKQPPKEGVNKDQTYKERGPGLPGAHAVMAKVCELSEEQQQKIAEINAAKDEAIKPLKLAKDEKYEELKKAKEAGDKEAIKKASAELAAVKTKWKEILKKAKADVMAVLTDEQKTKWHKYSLLTSVKRRFKAANLTDEQLGQIKALCDKTDPDVDLSDRKARLEVLHKLYGQVEKDILTDEQREAVAPKRDPEPTTKPYGYPAKKPPAAKR